MLCDRCGMEVPDGTGYCPACGADLRGVPAAGSAPGILGAATVIGAAVASPLAPGTLVGNRYEVRELLGAGGTGVVYRVHDRHLRREIALKVLHPHLVADESAVERFVREAQVSLGLAHPNIVRVHDIGQAGELRYLTMELLRGRSLRAHLDVLKARGESVPVDQARRILGEVLAALSYAHRVTVHRDVKPENVFLEELPGGGIRVKLLDFGIAKILDPETPTRTGVRLGTAWYVAPEQMEPGREVDQRADLYSVGVLAYELLTGRLPAGTFPWPSEVREDADPAWDGWIRRAMEQDPGQRFASAEEMLRALTSGACGSFPVARRSPGSSSVACRRLAGPAVAGGAGDWRRPSPGSRFWRRLRTALSPGTSGPGRDPPWRRPWPRGTSSRP